VAPASGAPSTEQGMNELTKPLEGRNAVVTGASRRAGIGFAVAHRLLTMGASVVAHGWTPHDATQEWGADPGGQGAVLEALRATGGEAHYVEADFGDPGAPTNVIAEAKRVLGSIDILVANHARSGHGALEAVTAHELDDFLHENVRATILLVKEFSLQHTGRVGGRVVMLTSGQHLGGMPREIAYAVSKGALQQATATLAAHLIERGITVNTVNPGPTSTGWITTEPEKRQMPLGRWGTPDDAARLITWLCTDDAQWITGQVIDSEGGFRR
jgi:3-oxoacyl-[acyl-carrier protein] reductase